MGLFSSRKTYTTDNNRNSLKAAMEEGLNNAYRFTSDRDCINDAIRLLDAFASTDGAPREMMMSSAASCVGGIRDSETRNCFMGILERCTNLASDECIELTAAEKAFLRKKI